MPDEYYEWGNRHPGETKTPGKLLYIPLDMSKAILIGTAYWFPVEWFVDGPTPPNRSPYGGATGSWHEVITGRVSGIAVVAGTGFGYRDEETADLDVEERHIDYTQIPVDDGLFDDEGRLIE
jgi:hypothetical protein